VDGVLVGRRREKGDKGSGNALGLGQPEGPGDLVMKSLSIAILPFGEDN
jgi:hypothetical protein